MNVNWYDTAGWAFVALASLGAVWTITGALGLVFPRFRERGILMRIWQLSRLRRQAVIIGALSWERVRSGTAGVTVIVIAEDQCATIMDLPDYERAVQMMEWMRVQSAPTTIPAYRGPWRPEYFTAYTGPAGDFLEGKQLEESK